MSSQSWRSVGGYQSYQQLNNMNMNNLTTDTLTIRKAYIGLFAIDGYLKVYDNSYFYNYVFCYDEVYIYGNTHQCNKLYLGQNDIMYLYGTDTGVGLNTTNPLATFHIRDGNDNLLMLQSTKSTTENYLSLNSYNNTVSTGSDTNSSYINFYDSNQYSEADSTITSMNGNLYVNTDKDLIIESRVIISNKSDVQEHFDLENLTVYGTANKIFEYGIYGNIFFNAGTSITSIAPNEQSTTFITLNTQSKQGIGIGGGILPDNNNITFGAIGTYDSSGIFIMAQSFASCKSSEQYLTKKATVGFNTCIPELGYYVIDANGPMRIQMTELSLLISVNYEFKYVKYCDTNSLYGIAIGSPIEIFNAPTTSKYTQYVLYTTNGGINWYKSRIKNANSLDDLEDGVFYFYSVDYQTEDFSVIAGDNNYMYYSEDYGASWEKYTYYKDYLDFVVEDIVQTVTITSIYIKNNVIFGGYYNDDSSSPYDRGIFCYVPDPSYGTISSSTSVRYKINPFSGSSDLDVVYITEKVNSNSNILFLANDSSGSYLFDVEFDFSNNNFVYQYPLSSTFFSDVTFNYYYKNTVYGECLIGSDIYYIDRGGNWTKSTFEVPSGVLLNHMEFIDSNNVVAVGSSGTFIYSTDSGATWNYVPESMLNAYGNGDMILDSNINLLQIHSYNSEIFIISYTNQSYEYGSQLGESKIYKCYIPTLFNRDTTYLLDVCGSVRVAGSFNVVDGGDSYMDGGLYVDGEIVSYTSASITGSNTNYDYKCTVGSIENPSEQISQGTLGIQGQNGMNNYNTWNFSVGTIEPETSEYDSKRLRIIDQTQNYERATIDQYGQIGIATKTPVSILDISGITTVSDVTNTSSPTSGALQVYGGVGIIKDIYTGGYSYTDFDAIVYKDTYVYGNSYIYGNVDTTSPTTGTLLVTGGVGVSNSISTGGNITIFDTTSTTSPTTGALLVTGGAGVSGSISTGGNITIFDTTASTSLTTGALLVRGGAGVNGSIFVGGNLTIIDTTPSTSYYTGSAIISGGVGIAGNVYTHQNVNVEGVINSQTGITVKNTVSNVDNYIIAGSIDSPSTLISQGTLGIQGQNGQTDYNTWKFKVGTVSSGTSEYDTKRLRIVDETQNYERATIDMYGYFGIGTDTPMSTLDVSGITTITCYTDASNTSSGAFQVYGGASIQKSLYIGSDFYVYNNSYLLNNQTVYNNQYNYGNVIIYNNTTSNSPITGSLQVTGGAGIQGSMYVGGNITITDSTSTISPTTGAFIVTGGAGIVGSMYVGGNITITDTTSTISPYTGALIVTGGIGVNDGISTGGNITIFDSTPSTSFYTGALIVSGGVGIAGNLYVNTNQNVDGTINAQTGITAKSTTSNTDNYIIAGSIDSPETLISQGTLGVQGQNGTGYYNTWKFKVGTISSLTSYYDTKRLRIVDETQNYERMTIDTYGYVGIGTTAPTTLLDISGITTIRCVTDSSGIVSGALQVYGGASISKNLSIGGNVVLYNGFETTSTTTGTLQVYGGVGIAKALYIGGNIIISTSEISSSTTTGALQVTGGAGIQGSMYVGGNITITDNTNSSSSTTGALIVTGGAGINQDVFIGGNITSYQNLNIYGISTFVENLIIGGNVVINDTTASTSTTTGALIVAGGVAIQGNLTIADTYVTNDILTTNLLITGSESGKDYMATVGSISDPTEIYTQGTLKLQGQNGSSSYGIWTISVGTTEVSTESYDTTRLRIIDSAQSTERMTIDSNGYIGINNNSPQYNLDISGSLNLSGTTDSISTTSGTLIVGGGAGFSGAIYTSGNVVSSDTFIGKGLFSTITITDDYYYTSTTIATSDGSGSAQVYGGIYVGNNAYIVGNVIIADTTETTSVNTGSLMLGGGIGISKSAYIGGNLIITNVNDQSIYAYGSAYLQGSIVTNGNIIINSTTSSNSTTTGAFQVVGGAWVGGNIYVGEEIYVTDIITSATGIEVTGSDSGTDYYVLIGSISEPTEIYTQGTLHLQGQNGMENYSRWNFSVGAYESGTSTYDTTRLRIIDSVQSSERMTIDSNGYVGINTTEPTCELYVGGSGYIDSDLTVSGEIIATTVSATTVTETSDYRIKQNIKSITANDISVMNMRPVSYYNTITNTNDIGLIAHELQELYPFMVKGEKDGEDYQSIRYSNIIVALINDVKQLRAELDDLRQELTSKQK